MAGRPSIRSLLGLLALIIAVGAATQWWQQRHARSIGEQVAELAAPGDIFMFSATTCASCTVARRWFTQQQVAFEECSIDRDAQCLADFQARLSPGTPVIVVRGQPQLGFVPERVLAALQR
jgi:arsenate reductase-like glutaredoxin family protein